MYDSDNACFEVEDGATRRVLVFHVLTHRLRLAGSRCSDAPHRRNCAALPMGSIAGVFNGEAIRNNRVV